MSRSEGVLPKGFLWGFATASYQVEGGATSDGRGPSIWDVFSHTPGRVAHGHTGDVACDAYHRTLSDISLLKSYRATAYRFSISWSRVIPLGGRNEPVNEPGLQFYADYVDGLLAAGIEPVVTLFHWDLPQRLEERYGGMRNGEEFGKDFERFARVMFGRLRKVRKWITINEPWCCAVLGYGTGVFAPGRCSDRTKAAEGDSEREVWVVGHNLLLAHARTVKIYREEFKEECGGEIGISLNGDWTEPWDPSCPKDLAASQRKLEFAISWFADPIYFGSYPASMRAQLGDRLPSFTPEESDLVKGSNDFYGMNHYTANYIKHKPTPPDPCDHMGNVEISFENKLADCIGPETQSPWLRPHPEGFRKLLKWISERYGYPRIYVTENGTSAKGESALSVQEMVEDEFRCEYFRGYVGTMVKAMSEDGVNVGMYLAWSLMDNFEWADGYETRFGVTAVDFEDGQKRYPKKSAGVLGEIFGRLISED